MPPPNGEAFDDMEAPHNSVDAGGRSSSSTSFGSPRKAPPSSSSSSSSMVHNLTLLLAIVALIISAVALHKANNVDHPEGLAGTDREADGRTTDDASLAALNATVTALRADLADAERRLTHAEGRADTAAEAVLTLQQSVDIVTDGLIGVRTHLVRLSGDILDITAGGDVTETAGYRALSEAVAANTAGLTAVNVEVDDAKTEIDAIKTDGPRVTALEASVAALEAIASGLDARFAAVSVGASVTGSIQKLAAENSKVRGVIQAMSLHLAQTQSAIEQRVRFEGNSGVTEVRTSSAPMDSYHQGVHTLYGFMNIHDHANHINTLGIGEVAAVLNGVEFWTRHNDYRIVHPSKTSSAYHAVEQVPFVDVPPAVLAKETVAEEIEEMREWFRAFKEQNTTHRDYRPYFKPVLCYLEGTWRRAVSDDLEEPFGSDRHHIEADSWSQLHDRMRFLLNSGRKNINENLSFLPSSVRRLLESDKSAYTVQIGDGSPVPIDQHFDDRTSVSWYSRQAREGHNEAGKFALVLAGTSEGLFIAGTYDGPDGTSSGSAVLDIECASPGCAGAGFTVIDDAAEAGPLVGGSATGLRWDWAGHGPDGFMYGPLSGSFDVTFTLREGTTGLDGVSVRSPSLPDRLRDSNPRAPVRFVGANEAGLPEFANWEYRFLCHPVDGDIPFNRFRPVRDVAAMLAGGVPVTESEYHLTRRTRFQLNPRDQDEWDASTPEVESFIDHLMAQVPGKNNYGAVLNDTSLGGLAKSFSNDEVLNTAYYSRFYSLGKPDAMGRSRQRRGYNDANLWAAQTTQPQVSAIKVSDEEFGTAEQRWSWAIPIEIAYQTPLSKWNPYNLEYKYDNGAYVVPTAGGRNGGFTPETAYNGTTFNLYYQTPAEFFEGELSEDAADTNGFEVGVLDRDGVVRRTRASGHYIVMPKVRGVEGRIRQRWPIAPLHQQKSDAYQKADALQDLLIGEDGTVRLNGTLDELITELKSQYRSGLVLRLRAASSHTHTVYVTFRELEAMASGPVTVLSEHELGHSHRVTLARGGSEGAFTYTMTDCDGGAACADGHSGVDVIKAP